MSFLSHLECSRCAERHNPEVLHGRCSCGGTLFARYDAATIDLSAIRARTPGMWRYKELLPVRGDPVSLGEPETPLLALPVLSQRWGVDVFVKDDSMLPGGTFKARGAATGVSRARELGVDRIVMPSAGNAGGAWSIYAARAGIAITVTMARSAPRANQDEVRIAGGELVLVDGTIADAGRRATQVAQESGAFLASTFFEPYRLEGKKSCFFECYDRLGDRSRMRFPATIVTPVGGGVAALAAVKAAREARAAGWCDDELPVLAGVQPASCAPIVRAFVDGSDHVDPWDADPWTVAAGMRVPSPAEGDLVLRTIRESNGLMCAVGDDEILDAVDLLARTEGVFACPEGASCVAAMERLAREHALASPVLLYNTGAGIKYLEELALARARVDPAERR